jgi:hypothetical protein
MSQLRGLWAWTKRKQNTLLYVAITGVFVLTVWSVVDQSRARREVDLRDCRRGNERTAVILDFILKASADPDPRQFEFIADPTLRQGAIEQSRRGRAEQRDRATRTFTLRDCDAEYPPN